MKHFRIALKLALLGTIAAVCSTPHAQEIATVKVDKAKVPIGSPVGIQVDFDLKDSPNPYCGLEISFGDGEVHAGRPGYNGAQDFPYVVSHIYRNAGTYAVKVSGKYVSRGLRSAIACAGDAKQVSVVVTDPASEKAAEDADRKMRALETKLRQLEESKENARKAQEETQKRQAEQARAQEEARKAQEESARKAPEEQARAQVSARAQAEAGATKAKDDAALALLFRAADGGDVNGIKKALAMGLDVNATDPDGWTPLMVAASGGRLEAAKVLLKAGANVNASSGKGETPLMAAVLSGSLPVVKLLLDNRADPNAVSGGKGLTALDFAKRANSKLMIDLLAKAGAKSGLAGAEIPAQEPAPTAKNKSKPTGQAQAKVDQATQAFNAGDYSQAMLLLKEAVAQEPQHAFAWHMLGNAQKQLGNTIEARQAYGKSLAIRPDGDLAAQTQSLLAKLPPPDLTKISLPSGLTLHDWLEMAKKRTEGEGLAVLREASEYLREYGPIPQLLELRNPLLGKELAAIKADTAGEANAALARIKELKDAVGPTQAILGVEGLLHHLAGNFAAAQAGYGAWLKAAPPNHPQRATMVDNLLKAQRKEAIEQDALQAIHMAAYPANALIRDCADCPVMVTIPAGSFEMGSNNDSNEKPIHRVNVKSFAIGKTEVTQGQWRAVMGSNPSRFSNCGDNCPVENVNWNDAQEFVRKLSQKTGKSYRLPSEAEWEYACRAGGSHAYCGGDSVDSIAWHMNNSGSKTHSVAGKQPNAWGLVDMSGNVWEWTEDCWNGNYSGARTDGSAWTSGNCGERVLRGGSWGGDLRNARSAKRFRIDTANRNDYSGFRLARTLE